MKQTPLYLAHLVAGATFIDFFGWQLPLHYGSQIQEHQAVRTASGMFDVSHMTIVDVIGTGARDFLRYVLANDVDKLNVRGKALYTCLLNEHGGIIDDLIVYFLEPAFYRVILNAATHDKALDWLNTQAQGFHVGLQERQELAMLAIQGPAAQQKLAALFPPAEADKIAHLQPFSSLSIDAYFIARTGYTGEDGFEILMPAHKALPLWHKLLAQGVQPCGLGARDTLRIEAGFNLYGQDMDESTLPLECHLAWTIAWDPSDRLFIGRGALELAQKTGIRHELIGVMLMERGVLRPHQRVRLPDGQLGIITSGTFSPTLNKGIGFARIPVTQATQFEVEIRGQWHSALRCPLHFYKRQIYCS